MFIFTKYFVFHAYFIFIFTEDIEVSQASDLFLEPQRAGNRQTGYNRAGCYSRGFQS